MDRNQTAPVNKWLVAATMSLTSIIVLIDMTIANVAMPHMMGTFGANSEQITWVLTAYTMAEAIFIPLTGYLVLRLGQRRLLLIAVSGFITTSMLCGQADSLAEMVFFRVLQGACGACTMPLAQSIIADAFPAEERGKGMAIYSIGIVMGPILGPTLGGFITEHFDWRWIFYINLPVGLLSLFFIYKYIVVSDKGPAHIDWPTMISMAIGLGLFQIVIDKGNHDDWFSSEFILLCTGLCLAFLIFFIYRAVKVKSDIAPLWVLKDRNLALSCIVISISAAGLFGAIALQPLMMQNLMAYPVEMVGLIMSPRGMASAITMVIVVALMKKIQPRWLVFTGLLLNAYGLYQMSLFTLDMDGFAFIIPSIIQGAGMGMIFVPLSTVAYATLQQSETIHGASIFNLCRTIGSSVGITLATTFQSRAYDAEHYSLASGISLTNPIVNQTLSPLNLTINSDQGASIIAQLLSQQAGILAYIDTFRFFSLLFLVTIPLIFLFKKRELPGNMDKKTT